jgi:hypothetical protein
MSPIAFFGIRRLPTISPYRAFASAGGLMSYGNDLMDQYRKVGAYTGRILNGEKPSTLPVEQAAKIEPAGPGGTCHMMDAVGTAAGEHAGST